MKKFFSDVRVKNMFKFVFKCLVCVFVFSWIFYNGINWSIEKTTNDIRKDLVIEAIKQGDGFVLIEINIDDEVNYYVFETDAKVEV